MRFRVLFALLALVGAPLAAAEVVLPEAVTKAVAEYDGALNDAFAGYHKDVLRSQRAVLKRLEKEQSTASRKGELEMAVALKRYAEMVETSKTQIENAEMLGPSRHVAPAVPLSPDAMAASVDKGLYAMIKRIIASPRQNLSGTIDTTRAIHGYIVIEDGARVQGGEYLQIDGPAVIFDKSGVDIRPQDDAAPVVIINESTLETDLDGGAWKNAVFFGNVYINPSDATTFEGCVFLGGLYTSVSLYNREVLFRNCIFYDMEIPSLATIELARRTAFLDCRMDLDRKHMTAGSVIDTNWFEGGSCADDLQKLIYYDEKRPTISNNAYRYQGPSASQLKQIKSYLEKMAHTNRLRLRY